uniref:Uncharacterized protein n=1 Tax=Mycobacterium kansasii TaxID=1768 RepID=A0A653EYB7_MYCKA|nr:hypothetical protein BIN_B_03507 [Mycobacterium kansasii]
MVAVGEHPLRAVLVLEHPQPLPLGELVVHDLLAAVVGHDGDLVETLTVFQPDPACDVGDRRLTARHAGLEQLLHPGQTTGDVLTDTTLMEGTHGQLRARLTDGLGGHNADRFTDVDQLASGHRAPITRRAHAGAGGTGQHRTNLYLRDPRGQQRIDLRVTQVLAARHDHVARLVDRVDTQSPCVRRGFDVRVTDQRDLPINPGLTLGQLDDDAALGAAVVLAHDDVLGHVHQATGQVARVGGTQRGVGQALSSTVGVDEVLEHGQALAERRLDRTRDELTLGVGHQTLHSGQRPGLGEVTRSTRVDDGDDRVIAGIVLPQRLAHLVGGFLPDLDQGLVAFVVVQSATLELLFDLVGAILVAIEDLLLAGWNQHVGHRDRDTASGCPVEARVLELVDGLRHHDHRVALGQVVDDRRLNLLVHLLVDERIARRQQLVEQHPPQRRVGNPGLARMPAVGPEQLGLDLGRRTQLGQPHLDLGPHREHTAVGGHDGFRRRGVHPRLGTVRCGRLVFAGVAVDLGGQVVQPGYHVQSGHGQGAPGRGREDVVGRQHQDAGLCLCLGGQRQVHGHLVTVEVGVERLTHQRVQLNRLALDQHRLERLDTEPVQGWRAVQQHRVLGDDLLQHIPHLGTLTFHHPLGALDVLGVVEIDQTLHHERLEQLQRHQLGQTALVQLELRTDHDNGPARVVDTLAEQVLPEPALLALQQIAQRLERTVARPGDRSTATSVVEQRVDRLLQHPLLVVDDDLGRAEVDQSLEPVVPVDHPSVQVVQVAGGEPATVELHHGTQLRRDHRDSVEHHAHRRVAGLLESGDHLQALEGAKLLLPLAASDDLAQRLGFGVDVEVLDELLDRLRTHGAGEVFAVAVLQFAVEVLVDDQLLGGQLGEGVPDVLQPVQLALGAVAQLTHLALAAVANLASGVGLGALGLQLGQVGLQLLGARFQVRVPLVLNGLALHHHFGLEGGQLVVPHLLVDRGDHIGGEVDDLLEVLGRQVQQVAQARRDALEVPDVGDGCGQLDVAHPFPAHLGACHLDTATLADDALEAHPLVFAAVAFPVASRPEDLLAEQAVLLRLERAVVDGLRLLDLAVGPLPDVLRGGQADAEFIEEVDV